MSGKSQICHCAEEKKCNIVHILWSIYYLPVAVRVLELLKGIFLYFKVTLHGRIIIAQCRLRIEG
jgi:hypothetical protein